MQPEHAANSTATTAKIPFLSIVIPSRNGAARLPRTLESIAAQPLPGGAEVIVVDDGSTDGTAEAARAAALPAGSRVISHARNLGRASACNSGVEAATGAAVLILDDDMSLEPGALERHAGFHETHPGHAAVGRVVIERAGAPESSFGRFLRREEENRERQLLAARDRLPFGLCLTGHFSVARSAFLAAGGFDGTIRHYGLEDIEFAYRLAEHGVPCIYLPEAVARHSAYMTDLDRYVARHREVGLAARDLAVRYRSGPFHEYLRLEPRARRPGETAGLAALRLSSRLLLHRPVRRAAASPAGQALLRAALGAGERLGIDRAVHFGYHLARDIAYFDACLGDGPAEADGP